jgi:hypothetical protein
MMEGLEMAAYTTKYKSSRGGLYDTAAEAKANSDFGWRGTIDPVYVMPNGSKTTSKEIADQAAANSSSSSGKSRIDQLLDEMKSSYDEAKQTNLQRYGELVKDYTDRYNRGMGEVANLGAQEQADIRDNYQNSLASGQQNLAARGLSGTTIGNTMQLGNTREMNADLNRSKERMAQTRLDTDSRLSGDLLGFKERREDPYPDMGMYAQLLQQFGRGTGGGGAGRTQIIRATTKPGGRNMYSGFGNVIR